MKHPFVLLALLLASLPVCRHMSDEDGPATTERDGHPKYSAPTTINEARSRARLLWELANGSLQVMHRDFLDEEDHKAIPSAALESMKWLNAGTDVVNTDHQPVGDFENKAAKAIARGTPFIEDYQQNQYQLVGAIRLRSQCLKCHLRGRTSTDDRFAGLMISPGVRDAD